MINICLVKRRRVSRIINSKLFIINLDYFEIWLCDLMFIVSYVQMCTDMLVLDANELCACHEFPASSWEKSASNTTPGDASIRQVVRGNNHWRTVEEHHFASITTLTISHGRLYRVLWWLPLFTMVIFITEVKQCHGQTPFMVILMVCSTKVLCPQNPFFRKSQR